MADKISAFLREIDLQNASIGTWGIGTMLTRAGAKAAKALLPISVKSAEDQFIISANLDFSLPIVAATLKKTGFGLKDPALFDIPTATFAVLMQRRMMGRLYAPCLVFITLRALSENSTHALIEGYAKEPFKNRIATDWVKQVRNAITADFSASVVS
jgi:hypothetical protein